MDLLSPTPFWPLRDGLPGTFPPLERSTTCEVAVIGAGITGACIGWHLADAGIDTLIVDRRDVAHGSTAGNTGLLLYELDVPLHRLARRIGSEAAMRAFCRCRDAVRAAGKLIRRLRIECDFTPRPSLYLAANAAHVTALRREFAARRATGIAVEWWPRARLAAESSLPHPAAILSSDAAHLDPYRLAYGLLRAAAARGARVHDRTTVTRRRARRHDVELVTSRGARIRARRVVIATGYEAERLLPRGAGVLRSTFALASEPLPELTGWPAEGALLWDTADPYLYLRTTADHRAIIGGYDEDFRDPRARDTALPWKVGALKRRFAQFFPALRLEVAAAWAGTFGISRDGLPFIGAHPRDDRTWLALGFGGNGTTFSLIAAEIIRDAMLGRDDPDAELFRTQWRGRS